MTRGSSKITDKSPFLFKYQADVSSQKSVELPPQPCPLPSGERVGVRGDSDWPRSIEMSPFTFPDNRQNSVIPLQRKNTRDPKNPARAFLIPPVLLPVADLQTIPVVVLTYHYPAEFFVLIY